MVTLVPFLRGMRSSREDVLGRAFAILLNGIGQNAAHLGGDEARHLEASLQLLRDELRQTKAPNAALVIAGSALQSLDEYSGACQQRFEESWSVWRDIVRKLLRYVDQTAPPADISAGTLTSIEKDLDSAVRLEEINALRGRIEEAVAELAENAALSAVPMAELARLSYRIYADSAPDEGDKTTGLPGPGVAMRAISAIWEQRENRYLVVFVVERLEAINIRFGPDAGHQIVQNYSQRLAQSLGSPDELFRWSGPCLLALIQREMPEAMLAAEMARLSAVRLEESIMARGREVILPVSLVWSIFNLEEYSSAEEVSHRVDEFIDERLLSCFGAPAMRR